jgi:replicative DNA helicase
MLATPRTKKSTDLIKRPPHSIEAEQSILGGLMLDNNVWEKIGDQLCEADFYRNEHRVLFRALLHLARKSQPFDVVTVLDVLTSSQTLDEAGGEAKV